MTTRQKVWTGLPVALCIVLAPGIGIPEAVGSSFMLLFSIVPLAVLGALLVVTRTPTLFWSAAVPALVLMIGCYTRLRFDTDSLKGIALLFIPFLGTAAALIGAGVYTIIIFCKRLLAEHAGRGISVSSGGFMQTPNKQTVQQYMDGFNKSDHANILACLTDDVEWLIPGFFHVKGKPAFDKEIENDAFVGSPTIKVDRMVEDGDVVVAEGSVTSARRDGGTLNAVFCDVFEMRGSKIRKLTSYVAEIKA